MKRKWKYDSQVASGKWQVSFGILLTVYCLLFIAGWSCNNKDEHKHIPTNKTDDLDGLVQPANQTVFSEIKTISPTQQTITPLLNATGVISYDPRLLNNISVRFSGRIEKLYVRFNFESVSKGQRIMDIYSPEILTEQQNLIYLLNNSLGSATLVNESKQKLQLLGLTDVQLKQIEKTKQAINPIPVYSLYSGHIHDIGLSNGVTSNASMSSGMSGNATSSSSQVQIENLPSSQTAALSIKEGMYVQSGQSVFAVYNIDKVWAVLNIFPQDAVLINVGDKVFISAETNPAHLIDAAINYMEPVAGQNASAIKARVYLQNEEEHHLKIGTLITAKINAKEISGWWLPRKAVVNVGQKQIVFLKNENHFTATQVQSGFVNDSLIQIVNGLKGNEQLAANAQYLVDSESFIKLSDAK
jgi:Cu(I)/Ag(I) efflux system membrane fusion protein